MTAEGTYPFALGGVSTWCDALLRGTPEIRYTLLPLMMNPHIDFKYDLPSNVRRMISVPLWGIEEPAEYIKEIPFAHLYVQKGNTPESLVEEKFAPLPLRQRGAPYHDRD